MKKVFPYLLLLVMLAAVLLLRYFSATTENVMQDEPVTRASTGAGSASSVFRDPAAKYYFTRHARCRMQCRRISQAEVKEVVMKAEVNYRKSDLKAAQGPRYALEGVTVKDRQRIRVIVAPRQRHLTIVTVIDLDREWPCPSCD